MRCYSQEQGACSLSGGGGREVSTQLGCKWFRKHMSSGWFDHTEPSLSTSLQGKQGVQGAYALVRGGSSTSNLIESSRITSLQR